MSAISLLFVIIIFHVLVEFVDKRDAVMSDYLRQKLMIKGNSKQGGDFKKQFNNFFLSAGTSDDIGDESHVLAEKFMVVARYIVIPLVFVTFNTVFWFYWFFHH